MGYRLSIGAVGIDHHIHCGKLYGYCDQNELLSLRYLEEQGLIGRINFDYAGDVDVIIEGEQLDSFLVLYCIDLKFQRALATDWEERTKEIEEFRKGIYKCDKYVLMWG